MPKTLLDTKSAAEILGVGGRLLEKWRTNGKGPEYIKFAHYVFYRREVIEDYKANNKIRRRNKRSDLQ